MFFFTFNNSWNFHDQDMTRTFLDFLQFFDYQNMTQYKMPIMYKIMSKVDSFL